MILIFKILTLINVFQILLNSELNICMGISQIQGIINAKIIEVITMDVR